MQDSSSRDDRDVFRLAPTMDASMLQTIADRLEFRGTDDGYSRLSQEHFARLPVGSAQRILALGCGTGIEVRALRRIAPAGVTIVGVDHSQVLVDTARRLTADEGLDRNVTYETADAHRLPYAEGEFDVVTLHTLISHVDDPRQVLNETCRVVTPGGTVAVFDGDYASMTFGYPDNALGKGIEEELLKVMVANPRVMRDMPRLLREAGLELTAASGALYAEIGTGHFWANAAQAYSAVLSRSGRMAPEVVEAWRAFQASSSEDQTFFGASNYYTYLARRPV